MSLEKGASETELLNSLTDPFIHAFIKLNKSALIDIAKGNTSDDIHLLAQHCGIASPGNCSEPEEVAHCVSPVYKDCHYAFFNSGLSESAIGAILLVMSLALLIFSLLSMVKLLQSVLGGRMARAVQKMANADLPGRLNPLTPYLAMLVGAAITILVQSSSVFTSTLTPLVGIGLLSLERMYPLTLGSNVGTTATGMLAALAAKGNVDERRHAFQVCVYWLMKIDLFLGFEQEQFKVDRISYDKAVVHPKLSPQPGVGQQNHG